MIAELGFFGAMAASMLGIAVYSFLLQCVEDWAKARRTRRVR